MIRSSQVIHLMSLGCTWIQKKLKAILFLKWLDGLTEHLERLKKRDIWKIIPSSKKSPGISDICEMRF